VSRSCWATAASYACAGRSTASCCGRCWRQRRGHADAAAGEWIAETSRDAPQRTPLGKALFYIANRWTALTRFLEDGALELDNGAVERAIRGIAIGRRNWLFAGSDAGAGRAAVIYTILESAVLHGHEPWAYMSDVLTKLAAGWPQRRLHELLPDRWTPASAAASP